MKDKDIGYLIKNIHDRLKAKADADFRRYRLTLAQGRVAAFLNERGGQATQKEIELFLEVSHPTVVGIVSRMEQNGHVSCRSDERDKRNKIIRLTPAAKAIANEMKRNIMDSERHMLASLSEAEIASLKATLAVILQNLER